MGVHRSIKPADVEIGMFVEAFEGSWFDHPFWRAGFLVETEEQLLRIRGASVAGLRIDESRSRSASKNPAPSLEAPERSKAPLALAAKRRDAKPTFGAPHRKTAREKPAYRAECRRAKKLIGKAQGAVADMFEQARLGRAIEARQMVPLAQAVGRSIERDDKALINLVRLKEKDAYTYLHSVSVCALMMNFARHLGLDKAVVEDLGVAGLLHDLGKIAIADDILKKSGSLSECERHSVRGHPLAGHRLLESAASVPEAALEVCLRHHEKMDGGGYPGGLRGEALSLFARMGAICDVYDAVTSSRPYKDPWTPCEALTEMASWEGHFDPKLLERFADSLGIYPVGTLVRVSTGELGLVIGSGGDASENVVVRIFFDCDLLAECQPFELAISPAAENPRIIGRAEPGFWRFSDWESLWHRVMAGDVALV